MNIIIKFPVRIIAVILLWGIQANAQATAIAQGTALADWTTFSISGPISVASDGNRTYTSADSFVANNNGFDNDIDSATGWTTPVNASSSFENDSSGSTANAVELRSTDNVSAPSATSGFTFNSAGSLTEVSRLGDYIVTADGDITLQVNYSLSASGSTELPGETAWINVLVYMEFYIDGIGPAPVASDFASINTQLMDGASGQWQQSGTLSLSYAVTAGTTGFFHVTTVANNIAQTRLPLPAPIALIGLGLLVLYRQRTKLPIN